MVDYLVLARKWRPQNFSEVLGQEHITTTLKNALRSNKISHAYLFTGPRGIGKTSTARILAKALNCEKGVSEEPCNRCASCKEIMEDRSLDVLEIDGASNRGIDEIRNLRQNIKFGTSKLRYRVYIIDEVHMLTKEAFNALLKTLEEPPPHVRFIFATTEPHQIPLTILSRCQRFDFKRISVEAISKKLAHIAKEENINFEEGVLFTIAQAAQGSLRDAESILEQLSIFADGNITLEKANELLGLVNEEIFCRFVHLLIQRDITKMWQLINDLNYQGKDIHRFLKDLIHFLRNLLFIRKGYKSPDLVDISPAYLKDVTKLSNLLSEEQIFSLVDLFSSVVYRLRRSETPLLDLEIEMARLLKEANLPASPLKEEPTKAKEEADRREESPAPVQEKVSDEESINLKDIVAAWEEILPQIEEKSATLGALLKNSKITDCQNSSISIGLPITNNYFADTIEKNKKFVQQALRDKLQKEIKVTFIHMSKERDSKKSQLIEKACELFDAKIIRY